MEARRTILVVDDVAMFRELEALFLAGCGRVVTATSGEEAIEVIQSQRPDIVVLDLNLPGLDGEDVCRLVKSDPEYADIPVIVVTGSGEPADHERALRAGAADVLAKPLSRSVLIDAVQRFVHSAAPRGLPRANLETPVRLLWEGGESAGTVRNLSRGGMFIESDCARASGSELHAEFRMPDSNAPVRRTVQVMWRRERWRGVPGGLGVRFLGLDRELTQNLEDFVHVRGVPAPSPAPRAAPSGPGA